MSSIPPFIPVDRLQAAMRGGWHALGAALLIGAAALVFRERNWSILWRTDRASFIALACVVFALAAVGAWLACACARWTLLAVWPRALGVHADSAGLLLRLGPFGTQRCDWPSLRVEEADVDLLEIDPDLSVPHLSHPAISGDLAEVIARFCKVSPQDWQRLVAKWRQHRGEDHGPGARNS